MVFASLPHWGRASCSTPSSSPHHRMRNRPRWSGRGHGAVHRPIPTRDVTQTLTQIPANPRRSGRGDGVVHWRSPSGEVTQRPPKPQAETSGRRVDTRSHSSVFCLLPQRGAKRVTTGPAEVMHIISFGEALKGIAFVLRPKPAVVTASK